MDTENPSAPSCAESRVAARKHPNRGSGGGLIHEHTRHTSHFTVVGNDLAQHPDLSGLAVGIGVHIQSLPAGAKMDVPGSFDPRTLIAAIEVVSRSNPENDWVSKIRDYPLIGIPVYAIFDPRTGTGAVLTDIHPTPDGPRYATRKDFVYGEDVTIGEWTIATDGLPRYPPAGE
ncbi:hypothetical protein ACIRBZ_15445 [Streptomyces sp. NPDC094038]|uniref:hypothetical protein n=1 Tax=Streptomyces sp. NPDC094038 TaxID=3366055 RepID=UPI00382D70A7